MGSFFQQLPSIFYFRFPIHWADWLLFACWLLAGLYLAWLLFQKTGIRERNALNWIFYILLAVLCSALFRLDIFPFWLEFFPLVHPTVSDVSLFLFSAIPWVISAVFGKRMLSLLLALLSGIIFSGFYIHTLQYTTLVLSIAILFNFLLEREEGFLSEYRDHPIILLGFSILLCLPFFYLERFSAEPSNFANRLDQSLNSGWIFYISRALEILLSGLLAELLMLQDKKKIVQERKKHDSPGTIRTHLLLLSYGLLLLMSILWNISRSVQLQNWKDEAQTRLQLVNSTILSLFTSKAIHIDQLSDEVLLDDDLSEKRKEIVDLYQPIPIVDHFCLFNEFKILDFCYPETSEDELVLSRPEIELIQEGIYSGDIQGAFSETVLSENTLSIIYPLSNTPEETSAVILARVDLKTNSTWSVLSNQLAGLVDEGVNIAFINTRLNYRSPWLGSEVDSEQQEFESAATVYHHLDLGAWGIELSYDRSAFVNEFFSEFAPFFGISMLLALSLGGYFLFRWSRLYASIDQATLVFSSDKVEQEELQKLAKIPDIFSNFLEVLKGIFKDMEDRNETTWTFLRMWQDLNKESDFRTDIIAALRSFSFPNTLFSKLLIDDRREKKERKEFVFSLIDDHSGYQYIDDQIMTLIDQEEQIVIGNTSRFHQLRRGIGKPFPHALIINRVELDSDRRAMLYTAYGEKQDFTKKYIAEYLQRFSVFKTNILQIDQLQQWLFEKNILSNLFNEVHYPLFIFIDNVLFYGNKAGHDFLKVNENESHTSIQKRVQENELYNLLEKFSTYPHIVVPKDMTSGERLEIDIYNQDEPHVGKVSIMMMKDISREKKREETARDFVNMLSHDLRSPLTIMQGYSKMLPMVGELNSTQEDYLLKIRNGIEIITSIVEGVLREDRIEQIDSVEKEEVKLKGLLRKVNDRLESLAIQKRIHIDLDSVDDELNIFADPILMEQAFYNLIDNAIKYSNMEASVTIRALEKEDTVEVRIQDTGSGIAGIDIPFIFDKYYHPQGSARNGKSHGGMGLYITKFILDKHQGLIQIESELGQGTTFILNIPKT